MDSKVFGSFVAKIRKEQNMTQAQLGERIGVTDKAISRWERGIGFPDINTLEPLANALGITILELMRSEKTEMEEEKKREVSEREAAELMANAAEMVKENQRQERGALWIGGVVILIVTALVKWSGHANLGGALLFGAAVALGAVSLYFYARNKDDRESRKVYGFFLALGVGFSLALFESIGVKPAVLEWAMYWVLITFIGIANR